MSTKWRHDSNEEDPVFRLRNGRGVRRWGFTSGNWTRCTRLEALGRLPMEHDGAFVHLLSDNCRCGGSHGGPYSGPRTTTAARNTERKYRIIKRIWDESQAIEGSPGEAYFRARGITVGIPPTLRYHPALLHKDSGLLLPAIVAAVSASPQADVEGIHRTFLRTDGSWKADVSENKMRLGSVRGGSVRLAPAGLKLVLTEGIEDGLIVMQETGLPAWAAMSHANLSSLAFPPRPLAQEIIIAADNDDMGITSAKHAAKAMTLQGREVRIAVPPEGKDFNETHLAENRSSGR